MTPHKKHDASFHENLSGRLRYSIAIVLIILPLLTYWQVQTHEFVYLDDDIYITQNKNIWAGLNAVAVRWAFSFDQVSYWHPLTWLSHMADCHLFGLAPGPHHFTSLLIHIANTLLLFLGLHRMTAALWRSFFVAALFALHPLNVESVAWVADRKNVLSTFFWMLTIWAYAGYAKKPGLRRYILFSLSMALGLLAKPMLVTLPFVLLLLDYWPLRRFRFGFQPTDREVPPFSRASFLHLIYEKTPLFALSAASVTLSYISSQAMGFVIPTERVPYLLRIENALVSYVTYIQKMFLPLDLAVFYPFPDRVPSWQFLGAAIILVCITLVILHEKGRAPYLLVGWFWYLGTLVPVIGLVQQGLWPAFADRFAYVPLIGLFMIIAWGCADLGTRWRSSKAFLAPAGALVLVALMTTTWAQVGLWSNSVSLLERAVHVTEGNHLAHYNLGYTLSEQGKIAQAIPHFEEALRIMPDNAQFHNGFGAALVEKDLNLALAHLSEALRLFPDYADAHNNMGLALSRQGRSARAYAHFQKAIELNPGESTFYYNLGNVQSAEEKFEEAISSYSQALQLRPDVDENLHLNLGYALFRLGRLKEALKQYDEILQRNPGSYKARHNRDMVLKKMAERP